MQNSPSLTRTEVERALDAVLARPELAPADPPLLYRWLEAIGDWLSGTIWPLLSRFLPDLDWSDPAWGFVGAVLLGLGALLGVILLVYLAVLGVRAWRGRERRRGRTESETTRTMTASDWELRAAEASRRERWREAAQAQYQSVVVRLGEGGVVRVDPAKTPGDYLREVRDGAAGIRPRLETFLRGFERVAYGRSEPDREHYDRLVTAARAVVGHG